MNLLEEIVSTEKDTKAVTGVTADREEARKPELTRDEACYSQCYSLLPQEGKGSNRTPRGKKLSPSLLRAWKVARPWLLARLAELEGWGWTRKALFRAGRLAYPFGAWGPAWARTWLRPGVQVSVGKWGEIQWTWTDRAGREITQASYLLLNQKKRPAGRER